jgi:hypothetical protein
MIAISWPLLVMGVSNTAKTCITDGRLRRYRKFSDVQTRPIWGVRGCSQVQLIFSWENCIFTHQTSRICRYVSPFFIFADLPTLHRQM